jgi:hypothetical protein
MRDNLAVERIGTGIERFERLELFKMFKWFKSFKGSNQHLEVDGGAYGDG